MSDTNSSNEDTKFEEAKYKTFIDERASLDNTQKESSQYFDKSILTLAAGALGLSLTFIDKIAKTPQGYTYPFLYWSWIFFCGSLLSTLSSLLTSQHACRKQIEILEKTYFGEQGVNTCNFLAKITSFLNWLSIILFILGIIGLVIFSILNFPKIGGIK
jgi:hypothetical protein